MPEHIQFTLTILKIMFNLHLSKRSCMCYLKAILTSFVQTRTTHTDSHRMTMANWNWKQHQQHCDNALIGFFDVKNWSTSSSLFFRQHNISKMFCVKRMIYVRSNPSDEYIFTHSFSVLWRLFLIVWMRIEYFHSSNSEQFMMHANECASHLNDNRAHTHTHTYLKRRNDNAKTW